jgi:WD40 repeat protein
MEHGGVRVGNMASGRELFTVASDGPAVFAFSADGRLLAVAGRSVVRLWETASGKEVGSIQAPGWGAADRPCATTLAFAPDSHTLATGHEDGTILLWDATRRGGARGRR